MSKEENVTQPRIILYSMSFCAARSWTRVTAFSLTTLAFFRDRTDGAASRDVTRKGGDVNILSYNHAPWG